MGPEKIAIGLYRHCLCPQEMALISAVLARCAWIDVNDATGEFRRPTTDELSLFRDALRSRLAMPVARRYSGGLDIHGACGMLAATKSQQ